MTKKVLIIGGTSGLGRELANLYCKENHIVGIIGRREELLNEFAETFPKNAKVCKADLSSPTIESEISDFIQELGGIDIFIVTASIIHFNPQLQPQLELNTVEVNVIGFTKAINVAYTYFKRTNTQGQLVIVTSVAKARGNKIAPAYNASKAYQASYVEGIRLKVKSEGLNIDVIEIIPGYMDTDMAKGDRLFWVASVKTAALQVKSAIKAKKASTFITSKWWLIYQVQKLMPRVIYEKLTNSSITLKKKQ